MDREEEAGSAGTGKVWGGGEQMLISVLWRGWCLGGGGGVRFGAQQRDGPTSVLKRGQGKSIFILVVWGQNPDG